MAPTVMAWAGVHILEMPVAEKWCRAIGGTSEVILPDRTKVVPQ